ncbi:copper resistance CopC/CopD family protein [Tumebacillus permanentifrigoris]|uniref:Copper transport protein n=1 Tax=Tumebacillus permanentifrigoris TaxID=378543 RepID=A0A316DH40_9BACL|nr:copper resistance protein CopC [Tumebacillus permanentifrigoris]PWK15893.1 copper transport protein [Tumebacillus permanentifrigoris]
MRKICIHLLVFVLFLFSFGTSSAYAHANLTKTTPSNGSLLTTTPESVALEFSEPLEPDLIGLKLYDWTGAERAIDNPHLAPGKPNEMIAPLPQLDDGTYTVAWSVISEDGHPVNGSYSFSIGTASEGRIAPATSSKLFQHSTEIGLIVLRYVVEGFLLLGAGLYGLAHAARRFQLPRVEVLLSRKHRTLIWSVLLLLTAAQWMVYSAGLPGGGITSALLNGHWNVLLESSFATMLIVQLGLLLLLALRGMQEIWYPLIWALLVSNLAFGGHARGVDPEWLALSLRVLHLLVIALWLGGLSYLALTMHHEHVHGERIDRTKFRPFFVRLMVAAVLLTTITGIAMTEVQTDWFSVLLFRGGMWGNLLWLKIALMLVMILLAFYQTMRWKQDAGKLSFELLRVEWLVGILVIQVAIFLSQMPYPAPIKPYSQTLQAEQRQVDVRIPQLVLGKQTMTITLPEAPQAVKAELKMMDMEMGSLDLKPVQIDATHYNFDIPFTMSGNWKYTITATYPTDQQVVWTDTIRIPLGGISR